VRVIKPTRVKAYAREFPDAAEALLFWLEHAQRADWLNLIEVRSTFSHADPVKVRSGHTVTVFNVRGNRYRLITAIHYRTSVVYVLRFLTHAEYDREKWKEEL
jgi:mRNA interferase HigB